MNGPITDLQRTYNGPALEGVGSSRRISLKPVLILEMGFGMVFTSFLKDNVHFVIAIENNGIIVTGAFFRVFQACRIRRISLDLMLVVMLLRLSAAYILPSDSYITVSLSLV